MGTNEREIKKMHAVLSRLLPSIVTVRVAPHEHVIRFCSRLNLPPCVESLGEQIAKNVVSHLEGKNPRSIAAASIYMAVQNQNVPCSEKDIAEAAGVSPATVKNIFKAMAPYVTI